uniref:Myc box-dependent-interacting protein 1 n=1 Tax=Eptatretus burgeri TaxID=7764 RepID=A0A8C4QY20_EPTBU
MFLLTSAASFIKVLQEAGAQLNQDLMELYDTSWPGQEELNTIVEMSSLLWEDYHEKLQGQALISLENYLAQFPDIKARIAKRSRKLVDYDSARHHMAGLQQAKKQDEAKLTKADEEFQKVQKVFEEINSELHEELPILWNSRVGMYINMFQNLACIEDNFHKEIAKLSHDLFELMSQLAVHQTENTSSLSSPTRKAPPRPVTSPWTPADSPSNIDLEEGRTLSSSSLSSSEPMENCPMPEELKKTSSQDSPCHTTLIEEENGPGGIPQSPVVVTAAEGEGETTAALMGTKMPSPVHSPTKPVPSALASPTNKQPTANPRQAPKCQITPNAFESPSPEFKPEASSKVPHPSPLPASADFPSHTDCSQSENYEVDITPITEMIVHPGFGQETAQVIASRHTSNICSDLLTSPCPRNNNGATTYTDLPSNAEQGASGPGAEQGASRPGAEQGASRPGAEQGASGPGAEQGASGPGAEQGASGPGTEQGASGPGTEQGASGPAAEQEASVPSVEQGASGPGAEQEARVLGTEQGASSPGKEQGVSAPGKEQGASGPGAEQGASGPGKEQGASGPGAEQGASGPSKEQGVSAPGKEQVASGPGAEQGASGPGKEQEASGPGAEQGASGPSKEQGASGPGTEQGASVPKLLEIHNPTQRAKDKDLTPTTNKNTDLPPGFLYKVIAEHEYAATDSDELTLREGDVILVVAPHSLEEQDDGWLTGVKNADWQKHGTTQGFAGVFPENFTERLL